MMIFLFFSNLLMGQVFAAPSACFKTANEAIVKIVESDSAKLTNALFTPAKTFLLVSEGKFLYANTSITINSKQSKTVNLNITFSKNETGFIFIKIENIGLKVTYDFSLSKFFKEDLGIRQLEYLGGGANGLVFKVKYSDNTVKTLKLYYQDTPEGSSAKRDFTIQSMLYTLFGNNTNIGVGFSQYKMLNRKIKIKETMTVDITEDNPSGFLIKNREASVIEVENLAKGNIFKKIYLELATEQHKLIANKVLSFFAESQTYTAKKTIIEKGISFQGDLTSKAIDKIFNIDYFIDYLAYRGSEIKSRADVSKINLKTVVYYRDGVLSRLNLAGFELTFYAKNGTTFLFLNTVQGINAHYTKSHFSFIDPN